MKDRVRSGQRRRGWHVVAATSILSFLLVACVATTSESPSDSGLSTASWPADRAIPGEQALASGAADGGFIADAHPIRSLAPDEHTMRWHRVAPRARWTASSPPVLAFYAPYFNRMHVLAPPDYVPRTLSLRDIGFDADRSRHALLIDLPTRWDASQPVYVALEPSRRLAMRIRLESRAAFAASDIHHLRIVLPLLGVLAFIAFVGAIFGLVLRERDLLFLAGALGAMLFFQGMILGEFYALPGGDHLAATGFRAVWTARALQEAFLVLFAMTFLALRQRAPRLSNLLTAVAIGLFVVAVLAWAPLGPYAGWLSRTGSVLLASAVLLMLGAAIIVLRQGSRQAWFFLLAWLPLMLLDGLRELALLGWLKRYPENEYLPLIAVICAAGMFAFGVADRLLRVRRERDAAIVAAEHDPLTSTLSRTAILARLHSASSDLRNGVALMYLDIDHFKSINDRFGHAIGDACLQTVVKVVAAELRRGDSMGRLGGEEFLVVLPGASQDDAQRLAERARSDVQRECAQIGGRPVGLTLSIGVAANDAGADCVDLVERADAAMYAAKLQGRNRVQAALAPA
jgi:diguanylate cyclase (GGDEF)-like protein